MKNLFRTMSFMPLCHTLKFTHIIMKNRKAVICQHNTSSTGTIILRPPPLMVCVCVFFYLSLIVIERRAKRELEINVSLFFSPSLRLCLHPQHQQRKVMA